MFGVGSYLKISVDIFNCLKKVYKLLKEHGYFMVFTEPIFVRVEIFLYSVRIVTIH